MSAASDLSGRHIAMLVRWFSDGGGLERYCHKLVERLLALGLRITVVCEENKSSLEHENLEVIAYGASPERLSKGETYRYAFRKTREVLEGPDIGKIDLIHSQHLATPRFDVVTFHNHTVMRLTRKGKLPERLINSMKVSFTDRYQTKHGFDRMLCRDAKVRVFVSGTIKEDYYQEFGLDEEDPFVIAMPGVDCSAAESAEGPVEFERIDPFSFLFVGKGFRMKGLDVVFSACRILKQQGLPFRLDVAGLDAKPIDRMRMKALSIEDRVHYLGYRTDMKEVFARSCAILTVSRLDSFGMAPLESMLQGVVPIVSRNCGVSEIIRHEGNGLILEDHLDAKSLAVLMRRLILEPDVLHQLSGNARQAALEMTWEKTAEATLGAYRMALQ